MLAAFIIMAGAIATISADHHPAGSPAAAHSEEAWAIAYTSYVERFCTGWERKIDVIPLDVLPSVETWNGPWGDDGVLMQAWRGGMRAADAAHRADPDFCVHPVRSQPDRAPLLNRILVNKTARH